MSWRTVYISDAAKVSLNLDCLQVIHQKQKYNIALNEIATVIIEDYKTVITVRLLARLSELGINVVFTSKNKMPVGALHPLSNNSRTAKVSRIQLELDKVRQQNIWKQIIEIKINNQAEVLDYFQIESKYLKQYSQEVELGDISNKEGQAARIYFKKLFGEKFVRFSDDIYNYCLNYAYQVIRSKIAQAIIDRGLNPSIGIFHRGEYNYFNLADDLIEPYRPLVDFYVCLMLEEDQPEYLTVELKKKLLQIYQLKVAINNRNMKLIDSIKVYMNNIVDFYNGKTNEVTKFPKINAK